MAVFIDRVCHTGQSLYRLINKLTTPKAALGEEPVGWQRWRRQLLEQNRDKVIVFAHGYYGIFHVAEYSLLLGAKLKDVPPEIGTLQEVLAKYGLTAHG
jgi:hypothetical protein